MSEKPRVLWMSDSPTAVTGFGTVTREILGRLSSRGYDVAALGWGYDGWPYDQNEIPYTVYPSRGQPFGRDRFDLAVKHFQPDILLTLSDPWMVEWVRSAKERAALRWVAYFTVDGDPLPTSWIPTVRATDAAILPTRFGQRVVQKACPSHDVGMIYHGVDTSIFRPLPERNELRARQKLSDRFVIGCVARNQPRKQLPILLKAFAQFASRHDDAFLYLHSDPNDIGWDLQELLRRYKIADRTGISSDATVDKGVSPSRLNEIYNLFDLFVLPTAAEGFGLPIIEAMAAGVPVVATNYSACVELLKERGATIPVKAMMTVGRYGVEQALPDVDALVEILEDLYADPKIRTSYRNAGLEFAKTLDWDSVVDTWETVFHTVHQSKWSPAQKKSDGPPSTPTEEKSSAFPTIFTKNCDAPDSRPDSLLVASLPRSLSTLIYHLSSQAIGLKQPSWTTDGEILNTHRFEFMGSDASENEHTGSRYLRPDAPSCQFEHLCDFLHEVVQPKGYAYKDVVQPFVVSAWLEHTTLPVLKIYRAIEDVAWSMLHRGWHYPGNTVSDPQPDPSVGLIRGLIEAERTLRSMPGVAIEWDEMVHNEHSLTQALSTLYPAHAVAPIRFHTPEFLADRDQILERRERADVHKLRELVSDIRKQYAPQT